MIYLSQIGLHTLKTAVEAGTFRAAAEKLNISQPAVSSHVHRIEEELKTELFERPYGRKLKMTNVGKLLYQHAVDILAKNEELEKEIRGLVNGELGEVRIAYHVGKFVMPTMVTAFKKMYPDIYFILRIGNVAQVEKFVAGGEVDFGLSLSAENPHLNYIPFYREPVVMFCATGHPLAGQNYVDEADIRKYGFISSLYHSEINRFLYNSLVSIGVKNLKDIAQIEDPDTILKLVEEGNGVGILLRSAVQSSLERGSITELSFCRELNLPPAKIYKVFRRGARLSSAANIFIKFLNDETSKYFPFIMTCNNKF